ncbi:MAG: hypothetical protein KF858_12430 [Candidatus Sumerlaeia bacterium]|nr:hypothetical protein [Candidatus Sumerlaeia bacterium]
MPPGKDCGDPAGVPSFARMSAPADSPQRETLSQWWRRPEVRVQALLLLPCAWVLAASAASFWEQVIDDAFITFRFARNVAEGHGFVFDVGGPAVEGFTNFTWLLLSTAAYRLGCDVLLACKVAGLLCGLATLAAAWRLSAAVREREDCLNVLAPAFVAMNAHFAFWMVQGLETPLHALLLTATVWRGLRESDEPWRWPLAPVLGALAAMTRPDSVVLLVPVALWILARATMGRVAWRRVGTLAAIGVGILLPYMAWRVMTFGDWLPNTYYAKVASEPANVGRAWAHVVEFGWNQAGWSGDATRWNSLAWTALLLAGLLGSSLLGTMRARLLVVGAIALQVAYLFHIGADWMPGFRFLVPLVPLLGLAIACALDGWVQACGARRWPRVAARVFVAGALAVAAVEQFRVSTAYVFGESVTWYERDAGWLAPAGVAHNFNKPFQPELLGVTEALVLETQDGTTILMSDIGLPMWAAPHLRLIDVDGLTDKVIADAPSARALAFGGFGLGDLEGWRHRERVLARATAYVLEHRRPEYVLAFEQHFGRGPDNEGAIYPRLVANVLALSPDEWLEIARTPKTASDVWNHLLLRADVPRDVPDVVRRARLSRAARENPRIGAFVRWLYRDFGDRGDEAAVGMVRRSVARFAGDADFVREMLFLAAQYEDVATARAVYDGARREEFLREAWPHRMMSRVHQRRGEWREALDVLERGTARLAPHNNELLHEMAWILESRLDDGPVALAVIERALVRDPTDPRAREDHERLRSTP